MAPSEGTESRVAKRLIVTASALLVGILLLAAGHVSGSRFGFYAGLLVTLAGVLTGIQQLLALDHARRGGR